jgi:protein ImuA
MPQPAQNVVIERLREAIRNIEHRPAQRQAILATGLPEVDAVLPGGGFRRGALSEVRGGRASGKTAIVLATFAALGTEELAAYVDGRGELYPPAAAAAGVDLRRLLVVRPAELARVTGPHRAAGGALAALWAAEALLASGAFGVVAIDVALARAPAAGDAISRRLQAAAERGGTVGLWLATAAGEPLRLTGAIRIEAGREGARVFARRVSAATGGSDRAA